MQTLSPNSVINNVVKKPPEIAPTPKELKITASVLEKVEDLENKL